MPIDTQTPRSPGWWFQRLLRKLTDRVDRLELLDSYYRGNAGLPEGAENSREAYRKFQRKARTNFAELVVEAVRERMIPVGFRTGAVRDDAGDAKAWRIWQANALDADSALVHRAMLVMREAYVIVGGVDPDLGVPLITPEDPRQVITAQDPRYRRRAIAALKAYYDDVFEVDRAVLFLPGLVYKASRPRRGGLPPSSTVQGWEWDDGTPERLPAPIVPVVRFANRENLYGEPMGEFEGSLDVLDRINHMILQRMVIATIQAFRQRAIKGVPVVDENGNDIDYSGVFVADPGAVWLIPETADIWESGEVQLTGILQSVRHDVQDLAATTRTPLFYLTPDANNGSAEGASLAREGLLFKVEDRISQASEAWEEVMATAFLFAGETRRARRADMEVIWKDPKRSSESEKADAFGKLVAAGVPVEVAAAKVLQLTPQEIERLGVALEAERERQAEVASAVTVPAQEAESPTPPPPQGQ